MIGVLAVAGLAISGYLTWCSFIIGVGVCPLTGYFGCSEVLTSPYSRILGVSVAVVGLLWFLATMFLSLLVASDEKWLGLLLVWSLLGLAGIIGLVYIEIFLIGALCPLCTSAHALGLAILGVSLNMWIARRH